MDIAIHSTLGHVEVIAKFEAFTRVAALKLVDALVVTLSRTRKTRLVVEVIAPAWHLRLPEHMDVWDYAFEKELFRVQMAVAVPGRVLTEDAQLSEGLARNTGLTLRIFATRAEAISWLQESDELRTRLPSAARWFETEYGYARRALASTREMPSDNG